ncbi:hypothetical protein HAX54_048318, partial [Datura stramonium]|nr:hypothetical protein [Datura stramonium]
SIDDPYQYVWWTDTAIATPLWSVGLLQKSHFRCSGLATMVENHYGRSDGYFPDPLLRTPTVPMVSLQRISYHCSGPPKS